MTKKPSAFQPGYDGKHQQTIPVTPGMKISHLSHGQADHAGHHVPGDLPRDGSGKLNRPVPVHGGMSRQVNGVTITGGGHVASALDSLTGAVVPVGRTTAPGWGNKGVTNGNPLVKAPGPKTKQSRVQLSFGMKPRTDDQAMMHELGEAVLEQAFSAACSDDRMAHGRARDGKLLPQGVTEK
ncbi:MAG: hypothetical protein ACRELF_11195 [Gemmataceae bacterium]